MRSFGVVAAPPVGSRSHLCWMFDGHEAFRRASVEFLRAGVARGDRLLYVTADGSADELVRDLASLPDVADHVTARSLVPSSTRELYTPDGRFDRAGQLARYEQLTTTALGEGYAGLSVVTEATSLGPDDAARGAAIEYELAVDALAARLPVSAMCAYDAGVLGEAAAQLSVVHPQRRTAFPAEDPGFSLFHDNGVLRLVGEIDIANRRLFALACDAAVATTTRADVVIDLADLAFIDVSGLRQLACLAHELAVAGRDLTLTRAPALAQRCIPLLGSRDLATAVERASTLGHRDGRSGRRA